MVISYTLVYSLLWVDGTSWCILHTVQSTAFPKWRCLSHHKTLVVNYICVLSIRHE